jgi:RNA polymerase sigma-70 factor (ECF subfamily)
MMPFGRRHSDRSNGDDFIRTLFHEHGHAMLSYASRLTGDRPAAEDIVQETLIRAWKHSENLVEGEGSLRGWLLTVIRNIATDRVRARNARPLEVSESVMTIPVVPDHAASVVTNMVTLEILVQLSAEHRAVLESIYLEGRSVGETAAKLDIPPGTVKSRTYYALRLLRSHFDNVGLDMEGVAHEHA